MDKWDKLRTLVKWLSQGRTIEVDNVAYAVNDKEDILHMVSEDVGVPLPTLGHVWRLVSKIPEEKWQIMVGEIMHTELLQKLTT